MQEPVGFHIPLIKDGLGGQPYTQSLLEPAASSTPKETGAGQGVELKGPSTLPSHSPAIRNPQPRLGNPQKRLINS